MPLTLLLDSGILSQLVRPEVDENKPIASTVFRLLEDSTSFEVLVPEIADYELRRKLLHLANHRHHARIWAREALSSLDDLVSLGYLPLTTEMMRLAARLWAETRSAGRLRAPEEALDGDVILAAQAKQAKGKVLTLNRRHFEGLVDVFDLEPLQEEAGRLD